MNRSGRLVLRALLYCMVLLAGALTAVPAYAVDPNHHWLQMQSRHFTVIYHKSDYRQAGHALREAERIFAGLEPRLNWYPDARVELVLADNSDIANGFTTPFPRSHVQIYLTPPDGLNALDAFDDWTHLVLSHELTHVLQLDQATGWPAGLRHVFGRNPLLFPEIFQPALLTEGLAVYMETDKTRGVGRGQSSLFSMQMRAEVAQGIRPWSQVAMSGVKQWPAGNLPYLYGINFYQFISSAYGHDRIAALTSNYNDNLLPFLVNSNLEKTLHDDATSVWTKFGDYLKTRYGKVPYSTAEPLREGVRITHSGYLLSSPRASADGRVFYVRNDYKHPPQLMEWRASKGNHVITDLYTPARLDWNPAGGILVARPEICREYNLYFDLYKVNPDTGKTRRLTRCGRYHYAAWSPDGKLIAASRIAAGRSSLVLMHADGSHARRFWEGGTSSILGPLDWSPDGRHIAAAVWRAGHGWNIEQFDLQQRRWQKLTDDAGIAGDPEYTPDGKAILFTSDAGQVYNLRRIDLQDDSVHSLTRVRTGAFSPTQGKTGGYIYYVGYTARGYDLYRLASAHTLDEPLQHRSRHRAVLPPAPPVTAGKPAAYNPWPSLLPTYWTPEFVVAPDTLQLGAVTAGQDALGLHRYIADINHEFRHGLTGGSFAYAYADRFQLGIARLYTFDTSGNTLDRIHRSDKAEALFRLPWLSLERRLTLNLGVARANDRTDYVSSGLSTLSSEAVAGIDFNWDSTQSWPISISANDGRNVNFLAESSYPFSSDYHGNTYRLDWREYLRTGSESVLALRYMEGYQTGSPRPFELGGSTDPGVATPAAELLFNRRTFALRGYPLGLSALTGYRVRLGTVEWRFPLAHPEAALRIPPLGVHQLSLRIFAEAGKAWHRNLADTGYFRSAGIELVSDVNVFYLLNLRIRIGLAHGFDSGGETRAYAVLQTPLPF